MTAPTFTVLRPISAHCAARKTFTRVVTPAGERIEPRGYGNAGHRNRWVWSLTDIRAWRADVAAFIDPLLALKPCPYSSRSAAKPRKALSRCTLPNPYSRQTSPGRPTRARISGKKKPPCRAVAINHLHIMR